MPRFLLRRHHWSALASKRIVPGDRAGAARALGIVRAEDELSELTRHDISDWTRAESLEQAAKDLGEAGALADALASHVRRACS